MKVIVLSCNTGEGHNTAGNAIIEGMHARGVEADMVNALALMGVKRSKLICGTYIKMVRKIPALFGFIYNLALLTSTHRFKSVLYYVNKPSQDKLYDYIVQNDYDTVVLPHLFPAETITSIRKNKAITNFKCYAIATDYTCIPFWEETEMDGYIVPHEDLLYEYVERGLPVELLLPLGIPASERFSQPMRTQEARDLLGLPQDQPIFLVMTGSMGYGGAARIARDLAAQMESALVLVLAGRNAQLKGAIDSLRHPRIRAIAFTDQVPAYMRAADVVLTKPGGLSSTEAAVRNVPLVLTDPIPGCETKNAAFFKSHGMARLARSENAAACAISLAKDAVAIEAMLAAQRKTCLLYTSPSPRD